MSAWKASLRLQIDAFRCPRPVFSVDRSESHRARDLRQTRLDETITVLNPERSQNLQREEPVAPRRASGHPLVEFKDVSLKYDDLLALDRTTLAIEPGEFVAVVGPSGCGKSTLMKLATGLLPPTTGQILFRAAPLTGPLHPPGMPPPPPPFLPTRPTLDPV